MRILAIETSCDETAVAVVENNSLNKPVKVLSGVVASSVKLHKKTGGIVPEVAARKQVEVMVPVLKEALENFSCDDIDAIAVTVGPGLIGSLLVGVETAKALSLMWNKPIIPVNHVLAHLYGNWIGDKKQATSNKSQGLPEFPAVGLVVSGGHTDLVLMSGYKNIKYLGGTRDDAAGECFDKCARVILGVPYPGGPVIEAQAKKYKNRNKISEINLPRPMINTDDFDFSFSGLKTAVLRRTQNKHLKKKLGKSFESTLAWELQEAIVEVLLAKSKKAIEKFKPKSFILGGGVAANKLLRTQIKGLEKKHKVKVYIPKLKWCADNAVMIGTVAILRTNPKPVKLIKAYPGLEIFE